MASEHEFRDPETMLAAVRLARIEMPHFRHDTQSPGETSALARLTFIQVPELCRRMGLEIAPGEGHPPGISVSDEGLVRLIASDMDGARPFCGWLASYQSPATAAMFAPGGRNAFDGILEAFARDRGFVRDDLLAREVGTAPPAGVRGMAAAVSSALDRGR